MDNKLIMENYLLVLKSTVEVFVHGTLESSNQNSRDLLKEGLNTILKEQAETYDLMKSYGWYQVSNVDKKVVTDTLNKVNQKS